MVLITFYNLFNYGEQFYNKPNLFISKNFTRIAKFFYTADNNLEKVSLSLDKALVKKGKDIKYVMDNGTLTAYIPVNSVPTIKTPWEVFYDKFNP